MVFFSFFFFRCGFFEFVKMFASVGIEGGGVGDGVGDGVWRGGHVESECYGAGALSILRHIVRHINVHDIHINDLAGTTYKAVIVIQLST